MGRTLNVLLGLDETANALLGGLPGETLSGTVGRACTRSPVALWAKLARAALDAVFGAGHCARSAAIEIAVRAVNPNH